MEILQPAGPDVFLLLVKNVDKTVLILYDWRYYMLANKKSRQFYKLNVTNMTFVWSIVKNDHYKRKVDHLIYKKPEKGGLYVQIKSSSINDGCILQFLYCSS